MSNELHDAFEPYYINMGRNGIDPVGYITDSECYHVCTAPTNEIADMIVAALNRDFAARDALKYANLDPQDPR